MDDPVLSGGHIPLLHVVVVALPDLEAGRHDPRSRFEPITSAADVGTEIQAEAELGCLKPQGLVGGGQCESRIVGLGGVAGLKSPAELIGSDQPFTGKTRGRSPE